MSTIATAKRELVAYVWERFERYREGRRPFEARWNEAYHNTLGEYAPAVQGQWRASEQSGSRVFVRITRQRVREACRKIEPAMRNIRFDLVSLDDAPRCDTLAIKSEIERILAMARVGDRLTEMSWDAAWSGTGIVRVPVLAESHSTAFGRDPESGLWASTPISESYPAVETVPIWSFYPDPDAPDIEQAEGVIQFHRLHPHQLRKLARRADYDSEAVDRLIKRGDSAPEEQWEQTLRTAVGQSGLDSSERLALLEYWGTVPTELLRRAGVKIEPGGDEDREAVLLVGGDELVKVALNPWNPAFRPYLRFRWEPVPHQFWGVGVAENIRDSQKMINGATRLLVDNKALAGNCMFEIDVEALVPGQDIISVYPGKKWVLRPGAKESAIRPVLIPDVSPILLEMIRLFEGYADVASGVTPPFNPSGSAGRNATGLSIALSAAAEGFRGTVRRLDDEVIEPLIERIYRWTMEYGSPDLPKGPARVRAISTATTQAGELRSKRLMELLALLNGPLASLSKKTGTPT